MPEVYWNNCRLCKDRDTYRPVFRYALRHYAHAECGLAKWGSEFLRKLSRHELRRIPFQAMDEYPAARDLAFELLADELPDPNWDNNPETNEEA